MPASFGPVHEAYRVQPDVQVSVVIPAFNAAATIEAAVRSALAQTLRDLEVIVVDDGSRDDTAARVAALVAADPRVTLLRHPKTRGVSAGRNTALAAARGEWVAVLDADDLFLPHRLATMLATAQARGLDVVIDNLLRVDARTGAALGKAFPSEWMTPDAPMRLSFVMEHDFPGRHATGFGYCKPVFRTTLLRDRVGGYAPGVHCGEDVLALQTALFEGARVGTIDDALYVYHYNPGSLSWRKGAYPDVSRVNKRIRTLSRAHGDPIPRILAERQAAIDYDGFVKAAKQRCWSEFRYFALSVPKSRLALGLAHAALRRVGLYDKPVRW